MNGHEVRVQRRLEAPPEAVWQVITDLDHAPERISQITEVHRITEGPYAIGTGWRETRRMMGASETQELWVVENDPLRRTVVEARVSRHLPRGHRPRLRACPQAGRRTGAAGCGRPTLEP